MFVLTRRVLDTVSRLVKIARHHLPCQTSPSRAIRADEDVDACVFKADLQRIAHGSLVQPTCCIQSWHSPTSRYWVSRADVSNRITFPKGWTARQLIHSFFHHLAKYLAIRHQFFMFSKRLLGIANKVLCSPEVTPNLVGPMPSHVLMNSSKESSSSVIFILLNCTKMHHSCLLHIELSEPF